MSTTEGRKVDQLLMGTDEAAIDEKGRILVSKKKRTALGESFVLALGPTGCLCAYREDVWVGIVEDILSHESINAGTEEYTRLIIGEAEGDIHFDAQGRFVVPRGMRKDAHLNDKILLIGCGNRLEIWAEEEYKEFRRRPEVYRVERRRDCETAYRQMKGL